MAQAWHWVEPANAVPEIARVLSPGGRLGLIWNLRDDTEDWVRRLGEIIDSAEQDRDVTVGAPFGPVEVREFRWTHHISRDALLDLVGLPQPRDPAAAGRAGRACSPRSAS